MAFFFPLNLNLFLFLLFLFLLSGTSSSNRSSRLSTSAAPDPSRFASPRVVAAPLAARRTSSPSSSSSPSTTKLFAQWLENSAEVEVAAPLESCWEMWEDRPRIPQWMPWIASVTMLPDGGSKGGDKLSKWLLRTEQFGRTWEFSWLAQSLTPVKHQKIHWRSVQGSTGGALGSAIDIANRGAIRFYKKGKSGGGASGSGGSSSSSSPLCAIKITISYEVPDVLAPFASALTPLVERILAGDMQRFKVLAEREFQEGGVPGGGK